MKEKHVQTLFRSFILSVIFYCLPVFFNHVSSQNKANVNKLFKIARKLGIAIDFTTEYDKAFKTYVLKSFLNDENFIHNFLEQMPSGRIRSFKWRTSVGKNSFIRSAVTVLNKCLF